MASKIERLYFGSQSSPVASGNLEAGDYELNHDGNGPTAALAFDAADSTVDTAVEGLASIGAGNMTVAATANGYTFTYGGALADTNVAADFTASSVSLKQKADTVTINVTQEGVANVNEVQQIDIGGATLPFDITGANGTATVSTLDTSGFQTAVNSAWSSDVVVTDLGGGIFRLTFGGAFAATNVAETTISNVGDGSPVVTTTTQGVAGQHHIFTVTLSDAPTEGQFRLTNVIPDNTGYIAYNADAATVETALDAIYQCSVTGSAGGPWTVESDTNGDNRTPWTGSDAGTDQLRKACAIEIVTTQEGSAGGAIAGTAAIVFAAGSSNLKGTGALLGVAAAVFAAGNSVMSGAGALAGSAAAIFAAGSSTLTGAGALAGASNPVFTVSGSMASDALVGSAALVFGAGSSTLTASGTLAGSSALTFAAGSTTLTGAGALAGQSDLVFDDGTSTLTGSGAMAGSAGLTFAGTNTLSALGALAGASALVFGGTDALTGAGALAGSSALVFVGTATADVPPSLISGTAAITFGGANALTGSGALVGTSALAFVTTGSICDVFGPYVFLCWSHDPGANEALAHEAGATAAWSVTPGSVAIESHTPGAAAAYSHSAGASALYAI